MIPFPNKRYNIIYADPPWAYRDARCMGEGSAAHYNTMSLRDIKALPLRSICADDAVLFLWSTHPMITEALDVISAWGFVYKTVGFTWVKLNRTSGTPFYGLGRWTRGNPELCLLATRGHPRRISPAVEQLVFATRHEHSRKPHEVRKRIVQLMGNLSRIELFARVHIPGWDVWGDEV